ncbi:MAG: hypothetical protein ACE5D6_01230 [Candidatus Zixiibacteriota bacterium]
MNIIRKQIVYLIIIIISLVYVPVSAQIAVVVNDSSSVSDLSMEELKRIYMGKTTVIPDNEPIVLLEFCYLKEKFYDIVLDMSPLKVKKYWMKMVFSGEYATPPVPHRNIKDIKNVICENKGAICFLQLSDVGDCMNVLTIDGKKPEDEDYPLRYQSVLDKR